MFRNITYEISGPIIQLVRTCGMNTNVVGSSPPPVEIFSASKLPHFHKNLCLWFENKCCCPRTVGIINVNPTKNMYKHPFRVSKIQIHCYPEFMRLYAKINCLHSFLKSYRNLNGTVQTIFPGSVTKVHCHWCIKFVFNTIAQLRHKPGFTHNCFCTQASWQNVHGDVSAFRCRHVGSTYHAWPLYVPSGVEYQSSWRRPDHPWSSATNYPQALSWFEMTRSLSCLVWMECSPNAHKGNILVPVDQGHAGYQYIYPV